MNQKRFRGLIDSVYTAIEKELAMTLTLFSCHRSIPKGPSLVIWFARKNVFSPHFVGKWLNLFFFLIEIWSRTIKLPTFVVE